MQLLTKKKNIFLLTISHTTFAFTLLEVRSRKLLEVIKKKVKNDGIGKLLTKSRI